MADQFVLWTMITGYWWTHIQKTRLDEQNWKMVCRQARRNFYYSKFHVKYLWFVYHGKAYKFQVHPFGLSTAPRVLLGYCKW